MERLSLHDRLSLEIWFEEDAAARRHRRLRKLADKRLRTTIASLSQRCARNAGEPEPVISASELLRRAIRLMLRSAPLIGTAQRPSCSLVHGPQRLLQVVMN